MLGSLEPLSFLQKMPAQFLIGQASSRELPRTEILLPCFVFNKPKSQMFDSGTNILCVDLLNYTH